MRIAITLGASFLGFGTHAGFLRRLHELGVRPVHVAGSSAGAITAGLYAAGLPQERIHAEVMDSKLRRSFVRRTKWIFHQFPFPWVRKPSVLNPTGAIEHLRGIVGDQRIEDLQSPKLTIAHALLNSQTTRFSQRGSLATAMAASCCLPVMFAPIEFEGEPCHDGGIAHELPMDMWFEDPEVDVIVAHRIIHPMEQPSRFFPANVVHLTGLAHETAALQLMAYREKLAAMHGKRLIIADTVHGRPAILFDWNLQPFYDLGAASAQKLFDEQLKPLL